MIGEKHFIKVKESLISQIETLEKNKNQKTEKELQILRSKLRKFLLENLEHSKLYSHF